MKEITNMSAKEAMGVARSIAMQVKLGHLSYDDGREQAAPYLKVANDKIAEIAKKHGKRPYKVSWTGLVR